MREEEYTVRESMAEISAISTELVEFSGVSQGNYTESWHSFLTVEWWVVLSSGVWTSWSSVSRRT